MSGPVSTATSFGSVKCAGRGSAYFGSIRGEGDTVHVERYIHRATFKTLDSTKIAFGVVLGIEIGAVPPWEQIF